MRVGIVNAATLSAEIIKCEVGSAVSLKEELVVRVKGRDLVGGLPTTVEASSVEIRSSLEEPISNIIEAVKTTLERTPPELAADILDRGIMLTGGGALLKGLDARIRQETNLPVHVAEDPLTAVVRGTGAIMENLHKYNKVILKGNARLWRGPDLVRGKQITYELDTGWIRAERVVGKVQPGDGT